jgi:Peptidase family M1 domain
MQNYKLSGYLSILLLILFYQTRLEAQSNSYWQQRVKYTMDVRMNVQTNRFTGKQKLDYFNNSPDTLREVFYHLFWNAFQPGSMMDERSRQAGTTKVGRGQDWDPRVRDRISKLTPEEIGYQKIISLKMNGQPVKFEMQETILQVKLAQAILPRQKVTFDMEFESQVPLQVRRAGRDAANGVRYSMSQWFPKMCEYDKNGWHPYPYVGREFYGIWGDYDVKITIDKNYTIGGTGYLINPQGVGHGYETAGSKVTNPVGNEITWQFIAPNVHDFMWAADPDYRHILKNIKNGPVVHVIYKNAKNDSKVDTAWHTLAETMVTVYPFIAKTFGPYPYKQYSFIHGGDGGMEYPMSTLLSGPSIGTAIHEWMHSWYQMMMGSNEALYSWMDEGFTDYATNRVEGWMLREVAMKKNAANPVVLNRLDSISKVKPLDQADSYNGYFRLQASGLEEPMSTPSDFYKTNYAYSAASYAKGAVYLSQLGYVIGDSVRDHVLLEYYRQWKFKHPTPDDFLRVAETVSGQQLDWYNQYLVNTTEKIDYGIDSIWQDGGNLNIRLKKVGQIPMPIDLLISYKDGRSELAYVPMYLQFGSKPVEDPLIPRSVHPAWKWTNATYVVSVKGKLTDLRSLEIDPSMRMADVERKNNKLELSW